MFQHDEIRESPLRGRLHNSSPLMMREQNGCWTPEALSRKTISPLQSFSSGYQSLTSFSPRKQIIYLLGQSGHSRSTVDGLEIDFVSLLISMIQEKDFKASTTYSFACMIFHLCMNDGVPLWYCDVLCIPTKIMDIGLIMNEANVAAPRRGHRIDLQLLSKNLVDTVERAFRSH